MIRRNVFQYWGRAACSKASLQRPLRYGCTYQHRYFASTTTTGTQSALSLDLKAFLEKQPPDQLSEQETNLLQALRSVNPNAIETLDHLRDCYEAMGYWDKALETELERFKGNNTTPSATSLQRQGRFHLRLDQPVAARNVLQEALRLEPHNASLWTSWAAWHYHTREDCTTALTHLDTAVQLANDQNDREQLITCLQHQGFMWRELEEHRKALDKYTEALTHFEDHHCDHSSSTQQQQQQYRSLRLDCADMHNALEESAEAIRLYEDLLQEDDQTDVAVRAVLLHNLGRLYMQQKGSDDTIPKARSFLQESIAIKRNIGATQGELAKTYNVLGTLEAIHNPDKAIALSHFQDSLLLVRAEGGDNEHPLMMHALRNIAILKGKKIPKWQDDDGCENDSRKATSS